MPSAETIYPLAQLSAAVDSLYLGPIPRVSGLPTSRRPPCAETCAAAGAPAGLCRAETLPLNAAAVNKEIIQLYAAARVAKGRLVLKYMYQYQQSASPVPFQIHHVSGRAKYTYMCSCAHINHRSALTRVHDGRSLKYDIVMVHYD